MAGNLNFASHFCLVQNRMIFVIFLTVCDGSDTTASTPIDPLSDLFAVLEGSALIPFLESKLQANSFLEICNHASVYRCVISIIRELGKIF